MPENYISIPAEKGSVNISEDVIAVIAGAAIAEVDGVAGFSNTVGSEIYDLLSKKPASRGVKVSFEDDKIIIDCLVMVHYGVGISSVGTKVQKAVSAAVESMTGITPAVNVHVTGISFE